MKYAKLPEREELIFSTGTVANAYHVTAYETHTPYATKEAKERAQLYTVWNHTREGWTPQERHGTAREAIRRAVIYSELDEAPVTYYPDASPTPSDRMDIEQHKQREERARMIADSIADIAELRENLQPYGNEED